MLMSRDEIIADIEAQIRRAGSDSSAWCVGTATDSHSELFTRHQTEDLHDGWIYREAFTPYVAREVKDYFVTQRGTDNGPSGEDEPGRLVYAYKKTSHTDQPSPAPARLFALGSRAA